MKLPRPTVRRLMILVALTAPLMWWGARPYPFLFDCYGVDCLVRWSDGSLTDSRGAPTFRGNSWFRVVDWPDGSTGYYLTVR